MSDLVNEVEYRARTAIPELPAILSNSRALYNLRARDITRHVEATFSGMEKEDRVNLGRYLIFRQSENESGQALAQASAEALSRSLGDEWHEVAASISESMAFTAARESRMGFGITPREGYFAIRYDLDEEGWRLWRSHVEGSKSAAGGAADDFVGSKAPGIFHGSGTFRASREFRNPEDALNSLVEAGVAKNFDEALENVLITDAADVMARRLSESARVESDLYILDQLRRMGKTVTPEELNDFVMKRALPELGGVTRKQVIEKVIAAAKGSASSPGRKRGVTRMPDGSVREWDTGPVRGQTADDLDAVSRILDADLALRGDASLPRKVRNSGIERSKAKRRRLSRSVRQAMEGLSPGMRVLAIEGVMRNTHSIADLSRVMSDGYMGKYLDELSPELVDKVKGTLKLNWNEQADMMGEVYRPLKGMKTNKDVNGLRVPEPVARYLENLDREKIHLPPGMRKAMKATQFWTSNWKLAVTLSAPAFSFRNFYGDMFSGFLVLGTSWLNPKHFRESVALMRGADGVFVTNAGDRIPFQEIAAEVDSLGMRVADAAGDLAYTDSMGVVRTALTREGHPNYIQKLSGARDRAFVLSNKRESWVRVSMYMAYRRQGYAPEMAAVMTNKALVDYDALNNAEKIGFRTIFPFYTWTKNNTRQQFVNMTRSPGRFSMIAKQHAGGHENPDEAFIPDYMSGRFKVGVRFGDDSKVNVITGVDTPVGAFPRHDAAGWRNEQDDVLAVLAASPGPPGRGCGRH